MAFKKERSEEIIKHIAAEFLERESGPQSLITVIDVKLSDNERSAHILLSVLPEDKSLVAFEFVSRKVTDLREYLKKRSKLRTIPFIKFQLSSSEVPDQID